MLLGVQPHWGMQNSSWPGRHAQQSGQPPLASTDHLAVVAGQRRVVEDELKAASVHGSACWNEASSIALGDGG